MDCSIHCGRRWTCGALAAGLLLLAPTVVSAATLTYRLSGPLKVGSGPGGHSCLGDTDHDCLHNGRENELAHLLNPRIYWDEHEGCSSAQWAPRVYFQVRPGSPGHGAGGRVRQWSASDLGVDHWVVVSYYFLYPLDCAGIAGFAGHQGDSESVRYYLKSGDLVTWTLISAEYNHHHTSSGQYKVAGTLLHQMSYQGHPIVAADEDSHGSWPGRSRSSSDCAADMTGCGGGSVAGACDCFNSGSMSSSTGYFVPLRGNIGGPAPEYFNAQVLTIANGRVSTTLDVDGAGQQFGANVEYWHNPPARYQKFCGWLCRPGRRNSDGDCLDNACKGDYCRRGCSGGLPGKLATHGYSMVGHYLPRSVAAPAHSLNPPWYQCVHGRIVNGVNQPAFGSASVRFLDNGQNNRFWFYNMNNVTNTGYKEVVSTRLRYLGQREGHFALKNRPTNHFRWERMEGHNVAQTCDLLVTHDGKYLSFRMCGGDIWQECTLDSSPPIPDFPP